ncbi:N-acetylmuramoyl-L-alanine amidase [Buchnera aphidicola]|uniref:N-acetylmuramoyl-L-alanine amidase n=1 Tax=Buchnera aphidicola (Artemisaphis artemisicola) TaxID=1241836 RepID=A0A4D6XM36_9GAMM|nr:N-acetylmuramoyl-L-alanine amidase [Buchnera aphidicola]QCI16267.1 N-acetylmuramoyl-L-alanine amidase [Buchnera aphidicola (Artemisaphis artemisicola)]
MSRKITIAIDAGHGGKDPGAIGYSGLQEKKVNIEIALKLSKLLNNDNMFNAKLIRNDDLYYSLKKRKDFLKQNYVNLLISIHADSSKKEYVSGASIWIVSNIRMNREINNFIKKRLTTYFPKNIENIFKDNENDIFLKKTILDLQSYNFQKIELDLSNHILEQLRKNIKLHKIHPNYASLEILSSIHIPSILIETGFLTNILEEKKLKTSDYQNKIANSIYLALKNYFYNFFKSKCF